MSIRGGIIGRILNLFRGKIANKLKPILQRELCKAAKKFVEKDVNAKLATFPTTLKLTPNFELHYGLLSNPSLGNNGLETSHLGTITYQGRDGLRNIVPLPVSNKQQQNAHHLSLRQCCKLILPRLLIETSELSSV